IARNEDVARHESLEDVFPREQRDAMPLLQQKNSARDVEEIRIGDLKELVARKSLEDLHQRLAVVASRIESRAVQHALEFQTQHRDFANTPEFKERARQILEEAFQGRDTAVYDHVTDSPLARGLFVVRTKPGRIPDVDVKRVEAYLADAA